MQLEIFGDTINVTEAAHKKAVKEMRRSDALAPVLEGKNETQLLLMLAVERATKNRVFVIERVYIKYKKARERREKRELLS